MLKRGEYRKRTSLFISGPERILIDCGPDMRAQMWEQQIPLMDAVLITHEHGDHYLGLDELLSYRRCMPAQDWRPIPVYATSETWKVVEARFGYLLSTTLEKRIAMVGRPLEGLSTPVIPFKTYHGDSAPGSVGYILHYGRNRQKKMIYTSDFEDVHSHSELLTEADLVVIQSNWMNEPEINRPHHMSFQRALDFLQKWRPAGEVYLTHISDQDWIEGDSGNAYRKKVPPLSPLRERRSGTPYPIPTCQREWDLVVKRIVMDQGLPISVSAAYDGLTIVMD